MDLAKMTHQRRVAGKRMSFEIKNELEAARPVGSAPGALICGPERCPGGYRWPCKSPAREHALAVKR